MVESTTQIKDLTGVFVLKDMATFQEHSVVSREIIRKPSGTCENQKLKTERYNQRDGVLLPFSGGDPAPLVLDEAGSFSKRMFSGFEKII